jgi:hypothetical protein
MRPRAAEIRAVTALLDQEWDDVEDLARAVVESVYDSVLSREWWTVIATDKRLGSFVFGPYETRNKATKAIGSEIVSPGPESMHAILRPLMRGGK